MDLLRPSESDGLRQALYNAGFNNFDAELYIDTSNAIGIDGVYHGAITANEWHRLAWAVDNVEGKMHK